MSDAINYARFGARVAGAMDSYLSSDEAEGAAAFLSDLFDLAEREGIRAGASFPRCEQAGEAGK